MLLSTHIGEAITHCSGHGPSAGRLNRVRKAVMLVDILQLVWVADMMRGGNGYLVDLL